MLYFFYRIVGKIAESRSMLYKQGSNILSSAWYLMIFVRVSHKHKPLHVFPSPKKPTLHVQEKDPRVFVHWALTSQTGEEAVHSSTSKQKQGKAKWYMHPELLEFLISINLQLLFLYKPFLLYPASNGKAWWDSFFKITTYLIQKTPELNRNIFLPTKNWISCLIRGFQLTCLRSSYHNVREQWNQV